MANNQNIEFPTWKPLKYTMIILNEGLDRNVAWKKFRNSCNSFINKKSVRDYLLQKYNSQCEECGSNKSLQVDHVKSVKQCFMDGEFMFCNSESNLQILCLNCNAKKPVIQ